MSKLDELIAKHCPDGVEYKELKEVAEYARDRIDAGEIDENTYVGVYNLLPNKQGKTTSNNVPVKGNLIHFSEQDTIRR